MGVSVFTLHTALPPNVYVIICNAFIFSGGVSGTPWYFVNGVDLGISHALMYEEFSNLLDRLLN